MKKYPSELKPPPIKSTSRLKDFKKPLKSFASFASFAVKISSLRKVS